ncbi:MAG TPA: ATP-binding protein [Phototrophicaceae bacterium]|nr:ATP-binding protein [Phototrophicaceae bacterium]
MTRILIIEDETLLREEVMDWLTFEGYEVIGAKDGVDGVETAFRYHPELVISDITMPRLDGYGVLLELRSNPMTAAIPFIFVTARAAHDDVRKGMASGADDYITKPFTRNELLQAIESRLQKKEGEIQKKEGEISDLQAALVAEREQRLLKGKLVAMFSHDFRNPLTSILSSSNLLRNYSDRMDEKRRAEHLFRIEASVKQLIQMLDDMLLVSQMDSGNLSYTPKILNSEEFLEEIVNEFQAIYVNSYDIALENQFSGTMLADPRLLRPVVVNLLSNAIKYSPSGSEITVTSTRDHEQFVLTVADHGIGIPEEDQMRLFEAFQRGSNVGQISGTGLGLAIVKQAIGLHGGSIRVESKVNVGTKMMVSLPVGAQS